MAAGAALPVLFLMTIRTYHDSQDHIIVIWMDVRFPHLLADVEWFYVFGLTDLTGSPRNVCDCLNFAILAHVRMPLLGGSCSLSLCGFVGCGASRPLLEGVTLLHRGIWAEGGFDKVRLLLRAAVLCVG